MPNIHEPKLQHVLQFPAGEVARHQRPAGRGIDDPGAKGSRGEHVIDGLAKRRLHFETITWLMPNFEAIFSLKTHWSSFPQRSSAAMPCL